MPESDWLALYVLGFPMYIRGGIMGTRSGYNMAVVEASYWKEIWMTISPQWSWASATPVLTQHSPVYQLLGSSIALIWSNTKGGVYRLITSQWYLKLTQDDWTLQIFTSLPFYPQYTTGSTKLLQLDAFFCLQNPFLYLATTTSYTTQKLVGYNTYQSSIESDLGKWTY